jgi:hypothetical protein
MPRKTTRSFSALSFQTSPELYECELAIGFQMEISRVEAVVKIVLSGRNIVRETKPVNSKNSRRGY